MSLTENLNFRPLAHYLFDLIYLLFDLKAVSTQHYTNITVNNKINDCHLK